jgi:hypothetical protein
MPWGLRAIAGSDYVVVSGRFTPTSKTPINDFVDVLVFPQDYPQRQRWNSVSWNDSHSATTGPNSLDDTAPRLSSTPTERMSSACATPICSKVRLGSAEPRLRHPYCQT